jgi:hypothetical protein
MDGYTVTYDGAMLSGKSQVANGTTITKIYITNTRYWGTPVTILDNNYGTIAASAYTFDPYNGIVTFGTSTDNAIRLISGTVYNLNSAAAEVWNMKASHFVTKYDISAGGNNMRRSQMVQAARQQANYYASMANPSGAIYNERGDFSNG